MKRNTAGLKDSLTELMTVMDKHGLYFESLWDNYDFVGVGLYKKDDYYKGMNHLLLRGPDCFEANDIKEYLKEEEEA